MKSLPTQRTVQRLLIVIFSLSSLWWLTIFVRGIKDTTENYLFNIPMAMIPMLAGGYALYVVWKNVQQYTQATRCAICFCSLALVSWGFGNIVYLYYNLGLHNPNPFASWSDVFYLITSLMWMLGLYFVFVIVENKKFAIQSIARFCAYGSLFAAGVLATYQFVAPNPGSWPNLPMNLSFKVLYVGLDLIVFSELCLLLYVLVLYVRVRPMRRTLYIFFGFCFTYLADVAYMIFLSSFYVASWIDMLFVTGAFLQSLGVLSFLTLNSSVIDKKKKIV